MLPGSEMRKSGIAPVGDIAWGTHISHIYSSKDEFANVLAPYIKEGLSGNELCIWIYSSNILRQDIIGIMSRLESRTEAFLKSGQLMIVPYTQWYLAEGRFDEARVTGQWMELIHLAQKKGYEGVRAVGDTCWLKGYTREFAAYERSFSPMIFNLPLTVICCYDINQIDIHAFEDIIRNHSLNMIKAGDGLQIIKNVGTGAVEGKQTELNLLRQDIALEQKEKILLEILDSSTEGTYIVDYQKEAVICSGRWARRLGLESVPAGRLLQAVRQRMLPEDLAAHQKALQKAVLNREPGFISEFRIRDRMDDVLWVLEQGRLVYGDKGELTKGYGSFMDITGRKRHESQIKRQNRMLKAIRQIYKSAIPCESVQALERACLGIVRRAAKSQFSYIGETGEDGLLRAVALSGPGLEQFKAHAGHDNPAPGLAMQNLCCCVLKRGKSLLKNAPAPRPDGPGAAKDQPAPASFLGVPFLHGGKTAGVIAVWGREGGFGEEDREMLEALAPTVMEVLFRKRAEAALLESEKHARMLVQELKTADRNKNTFLNALSHELRNPLATVSVGLELMDITQDQAETEKARKIMKRQMDQLCHLVDDLLDLTRITNNKIELKKEKLDLIQTALSTADDHKPLFEKKGVALHTDVRGTVFVQADPVRLKQIIGNLLHNALKFTDRGGEAVLKVYRDGHSAVIEVEDTGIGIEPAFLPDLFEPFKQSDRSLDRRNGGLGLGLSIVKGIARLHGGSVSVHSGGLGLGSVFSIRLPLCAVAEADKSGQGCRHKQASRARRILLIEDNRDLNNLLCSMLELMGHEAAAAHDGEKGIEQAMAYGPDVIFCDIGLPNMNGFEVARRIRELDSLKEVFLVAMTGYAGQKDIALAMEAGFDRHLAKPVDMASLRDVLDQCHACRVAKEKEPEWGREPAGGMDPAEGMAPAGGTAPAEGTDFDDGDDEADSWVVTFGE